LPTAPIKSKTEINSTNSSGQYEIKELIVPKSKVCNTIKIAQMPVNKKRSPILLIMKAFVAALPA
jgi:hypothetical protein